MVNMKNMDFQFVSKSDYVFNILLLCSVNNSANYYDNQLNSLNQLYSLN